MNHTDLFFFACDEGEVALEEAQVVSPGGRTIAGKQTSVTRIIINQHLQILLALGSRVWVWTPPV